MKSKSLLMFIVAAFLILSCTTVGPKSALQRNSSQTVSEEKWVSRIPYYLEDIYDYDDVFFITQPVVKQALASGNPYYLEDIYDYDEVFFITQPVVKQTLVSGNLYYLEDIYDYDVFFIFQPLIKQILVSANQYYLEDIYDYDEAFFTNEAVINATADCKNLLDYFAVLSIVDETPVSTLEPMPKQTLASGNQYYLEDMYDY